MFIDDPADELDAYVPGMFLAMAITLGFLYLLIYLGTK